MMTALECKFNMQSNASNNLYSDKHQAERAAWDQMIW